MHYTNEKTQLSRRPTLGYFLLTICLLFLPFFGHAEQSKTKNTASEIEASSGDFSPSMLYLLDQGKNLFFFRGNIPEINGAFCYSDLTQGMITYLSNMGITINSTDLKLIDVSLLNYHSDASKIQIEQEWFIRHPETGYFLLHPLHGSAINPGFVPEKIRNYILEHLDIDGLKVLMLKLKNLVDAQYPTNFCIYIHCEQGKDRAGEASACYLMQYKGYSYKDAIALDTKIAQRPIHTNEQNGVRWYAFYLRDIEHLPWIGVID